MKELGYVTTLHNIGKPAATVLCTLLVPHYTKDVILLQRVQKRLTKMLPSTSYGRKGRAKQKGEPTKKKRKSPHDLRIFQKAL